MKTTLRRKIASTVAAGAALVLCAPIAGHAYSRPPAEYGNIEADATGSITIYKHEHQTGESKTVGAADDPADSLKGKSNPVADVVFKSFPFVNPDKPSELLALTGKDANVNWKKIGDVKDLSGACAGVTKDGTEKPTLTGFNFGTGVLLNKTDAQGMTELQGLKVGAYLLCEVEAPETVVSKAEPALVTIPHPMEVTEDVEGQPTTYKKWVYDVTIYPKNSVGGINKIVERQALTNVGLGEAIKWPVTAKIPTLAEGEHFKHFIVEDPMSNKPGGPQISERGVESVKIGETLLQKDSDYVVNTGTDAGKEYVSVGLTKAGLDKAENAAGKELTVVFTTKLSSVGNGQLSNTAKLHVAKGKEPNPTPPTDVPNIPEEPGKDKPPTSPEIISYWGKVVLNKVDAADSETALDGAKFKVYAATDETAYGESCDNAVETGDALTIDGKSEFVSEGGTVNIKGLWISDSYNEVGGGKAQQSRCYIIKETAAPDGYVLPENPVTKVKVTVGEPKTEDGFTATIENTKTSVPQLPLTGSSAQVILPIAGGLLIAGGLIAAIAYRRRSRENN